MVPVVITLPCITAIPPEKFSVWMEVQLQELFRECEPNVLAPNEIGFQ